MIQRLREDDTGDTAAIGHAEGAGGLELPLRQALDCAAEYLRLIGRACASHDKTGNDKRVDGQAYAQEEAVEEAKKGYLPKDLDVHHIFPLSGSESMDVHSFTNMSVIHKSTHLAINRQIFYPQLKDVSSMQEGETREIIIPIFKPVDAGRIIAIRNRQTGRPWQMLKSISLAGYTR